MKQVRWREEHQNAIQDGGESIHSGGGSDDDDGDGGPPPPDGAARAMKQVREHENSYCTPYQAPL